MRRLLERRRPRGALIVWPNYIHWDVQGNMVPAP